MEAGRHVAGKKRSQVQPTGSTVQGWENQKVLRGSREQRTAGSKPGGPRLVKSLELERSPSLQPEAGGHTLK